MGWYPFEKRCPKGTLAGLKGGVVVSAAAMGLRSRWLPLTHTPPQLKPLCVRTRAQLIFCRFSLHGNTPLSNCLIDVMGNLTIDLEGIDHLCSSDASGHIDTVDYYAVFETHGWHP
jgi:hypothetical protein